MDFDFTKLAHVDSHASERQAIIRSQASDFRVDEQLPFELSGEGEHIWLRIQKTASNTDWIAEQLAKFAAVPAVAVGFAGMKDRHAITTQWFSINLAGKPPPNWSDFETDDIKVIKQARHLRKLKRGVLAGNTFQLILRELTGAQSDWEAALQQVAKQGVPNYFGEQRFGHHGNNLRRAEQWFSSDKAPRKRTQKSLYLSAARSWLFNQVLSHRVNTGTWNSLLQGEILRLAGTKTGQFVAEIMDVSLIDRINAMDIHPTGPLWGRGLPEVQSDALAVESAILADWTDWQTGLEKAGLEQARRALRLIPENLQWKFMDDELNAGQLALQLDFSLTSGAYATAVLRELANIGNAQQRNLLTVNPSN